MVAAPKKWIGLAADIKPINIIEGSTQANTAIPIGSEFIETDTSHIYIWEGTSWVKFVSIVTTS